MSLDRGVFVTYPAHPVGSEPVVTTRTSINAFSLLGITQRGEASAGILIRLRRALIRAGANPPDPLTLDVITIEEAPLFRRANQTQLRGESDV